MIIKKILSHLPAGLLYLMVVTLAIIVLAIVGRFLFPWQPITVFRFYYYGAQLGLVVAGIALLCLALSFVNSEWFTRQSLVISMILGLLPLLSAVIVVGPKGFAAPMIHDISTDMDDPPVFTAVQPMRRPGENTLEYNYAETAELQQQAFPHIQPLLSELEPDIALELAAKTVASLGWNIVEIDKENRMLEAYETTALFGFIDDVCIRIQSTETGSKIDVRSISRVGLGDLGANAERIDRFFNEFNNLSN